MLRFQVSGAIGSVNSVIFLQARARLELRETATKSDAEDVVEIMKRR